MSAADLFAETLRGTETCISVSNVDGAAVFWAEAVELLPSGYFRVAVHNEGPFATATQARAAIDRRRAPGDRSKPMKLPKGAA